jgi:hypothetical protein
MASSLVEKVIAQERIQGKVLDEITKKPIRGASIINPTSKSGTLSNEEGEFELTIEAYPTELIFSHVSYQKMSKLVENNSFQKIELPVAVIELAEVQVGNPAVAILNAVIRKAEGDSSKIHYKKAFYQKTSQFKGKYTSIHESFMNVAWSTKGLEEWKPLSVRVAELNQRRYKHQNFLSVVFSKTRIYWEYPFLPLNSVDVTKNYSFAIEGYSSIDTDNELVAISCTPKVKDNKVLQFEGTFYVLTKFDALVSVKGLYTYPLTKWRTTQEVDIKYDIDSANKMVLNNIYIVETSSHRRSFQKNVETAWLYFSDEIPSLGEGKKYSSKFLDDLKIYGEVPYNSEFWKKNIPIKHTKIEEEVIKELERKGQFKSNFN